MPSQLPYELSPIRYCEASHLVGASGLLAVVSSPQTSNAERFSIVVRTKIASIGETSCLLADLFIAWKYDP
jgi:hypothetical protein